VIFEVVPSEPASTLWEGALTPRADPGVDGSKDFLKRRLDLEDLNGDLPVVSIGEPEVLRSLAGVAPPEGFERVAARDFYLVRFWCSFRASESGVQFDHAHFRIRLGSGEADAGDPIAHDMYPSEVLHRVKRDVKVSFTPQITFSEIGGSVGGFDYGFSYTELQPSIVAAGQGERTPSWAFSRTKGHAPQGGKAVHLVVATPAGTGTGTAALELEAEVRKPGKLPLPMGLFEKRGDIPAEPLQVRLW
jgi:hypothetical protein